MIGSEGDFGARGECRWWVQRGEGKLHCSHLYGFSLVSLTFVRLFSCCTAFLSHLSGFSLTFVMLFSTELWQCLTLIRRGERQTPPPLETRLEVWKENRSAPGDFTKGQKVFSSTYPTRDLGPFWSWNQSFNLLNWGELWYQSHLHTFILSLSPFHTKTKYSILEV